ncbi:MAG: LLM class flavin-dependent oxidoreductase [Actinomycetota bacterium]
MRYAVNLPNLGALADPRSAVRVAVAAEEAGWDGVFVWDHILGWDGAEVGDAWVILAAMARATADIRLGPMVTPLPRRRPWVLARQAVTLDQLSNGRLTCGVGLGTPPETEFARFGEEAEARLRAAKLDEGLDILVGMWAGAPFDYKGEHYRIEKETRFLPVPKQRPRIPIWVAGTIGIRAPMRRSARFEGYFPVTPEGSTPDPDQVARAVAFLSEVRSGDGSFDVTVAGPPPDDPDAYAEAGVTWYQVGPRPDGETVEETLSWVQAGPPG